MGFGISMGFGPARLLMTLGCAAALLAGCASTETRPPNRKQLDRIEDLTRSRDYVEAAEVSSALLATLDEESPLYAEAEAAMRNVSLASGLDAARAYLLADENETALELLLELDEAHPSSPAVAAWLNRARTKLADVWFDRAREANANERFDEARESYEWVLHYVPDHPLAGPALAGLERIEVHRAGVADEYYNTGVRKFTELRLGEAVGSFGKVNKYDRDNPRAKRRVVEVNAERAKARVASSEKLIGEERFAAAAKELAAAARLDPESEEIAEKLAHLRVEAAAAETLSQGQFMVMRGQIDRGEEMLREGLAKTTLQKDRFERALADVSDARVKAAYQNALDLEYDFRFPQAIAGYEKILESRDFYKDVRARLDALREYVEDAERLYGEAERATTDEEKLELLEQIDVFWPEYRDIPERIVRLKSRVQDA